MKDRKVDSIQGVLRPTQWDDADSMQSSFERLTGFLESLRFNCTAHTLLDVFVFWKSYGIYRTAVRDVGSYQDYSLAIFALNRSYDMATRLLCWNAEAYGVAPRLFVTAAELTLDHYRQNNSQEPDLGTLIGDLTDFGTRLEVAVAIPRGRRILHGVLLVLFIVIAVFTACYWGAGENWLQKVVGCSFLLALVPAAVRNAELFILTAGGWPVVIRIWLWIRTVCPWSKKYGEEGPSCRS